MTAITECANRLTRAGSPAQAPPGEVRQPAVRRGPHLPSRLASQVQSGPGNLEDALALAENQLLATGLAPEKLAPCLVSPEANSPSPAQRSVRADAHKANS
jgi:hypothetical protein